MAAGKLLACLDISAYPVFDNLAKHGVYCTDEKEKEGIPQEGARPLLGGQDVPVWFWRLPNCHRGFFGPNDKLATKVVVSFFSLKATTEIFSSAGSPMASWRYARIAPLVSRF